MTVTCQSCGKRYRVEQKSSGQRLQCRACGGTIDVPVFGGNVYAPAVGPTGVRELEYGNEELTAYVPIAGEETIDLVVPLVMLLGFIAFLVMSSRSAMATANAAAVLRGGANASAYAAGIVFGRALGIVFMVCAVSAPLCVLGVFIASRIMKFTNRPLLYWRCLTTVMTPFVTLVVVSGFNFNRLPNGPILWFALVPMVGVLWLMLRLRLAQFSVAGAFALLCGVGGPLLLALIILVPFFMIRGTGRPTAAFGTPSAATRPAPVRSVQVSPERMAMYRPAIEGQLKRVGVALQRYSAANGGAYPTRLSQLVSAGLLQAGDIKPLGGTGEWFYSAHRLVAPLPAELVLAHDGSGSDRKRTCLFGDGHVETIDMADWMHINRASLQSVVKGIKGPP